MMEPQPNNGNFHLSRIQSVGKLEVQDFSALISTIIIDVHNDDSRALQDRLNFTMFCFDIRCIPFIIVHLFQSFLTFHGPIWGFVDKVTDLNNLP